VAPSSESSRDGVEWVRTGIIARGGFHQFPESVFLIWDMRPSFRVQSSARTIAVASNLQIESSTIEPQHSLFASIVNTRPFQQIPRQRYATSAIARTRLCKTHSFRRAAIGSMREARNAGRYPARRAHAIRIATEAAIAPGSFGLTPKRNDFKNAVVW